MAGRRERDKAHDRNTGGARRVQTGPEKRTATENEMNAWVTAAATAALIVPLAALGTGATRTAAAAPLAQDTAGKAIFMGKGLCHVCHGPNAKGTPLAPDLTDTTWLHIDGKLESIVTLVKAGVLSPKNAPAPMPARVFGVASLPVHAPAGAREMFMSALREYSGSWRTPDAISEVTGTAPGLSSGANRRKKTASLGCSWQSIPAGVSSTILN